MDVRDEALWLRLARRQAILRQKERYNAALLPELRQDAIKSEVDRLDRELYEVENEEDIEKIERMAAATREKMKSRPAVVKRRWRPKPKKGRRR